MASSAFGFASAVQNLPNYFEFGKSLVGQGKDDLDREQAQKEIATRFGLASQQEANLNDFRAAELAQKKYEADQLDQYRRGLLGYQGQELAQKAQELPAKIKDVNAHADYLTANANATNQELPSKIAGNNAGAEHYRAVARYQAAMAAEREAALQKQKDWEQDLIHRQLYILNPNDEAIPPEKRREFDMMYPVVLNPNAPEAFNAVGRVVTEKRAPTPEEHAAVSRGIQPYLDMGGEGQKFLAFEPTADGQRVKIKLRNANGEERYMTHNRLPNSQGGVDDEFTLQEIQDMMGIVKDAAQFRMRHPEFVDDYKDRKDAGSAENYFNLRLAKERAAAKSSGHPASLADEKFTRDWGNDFDKKVGLKIDALSGITNARAQAKLNQEPFDESEYEAEKQRLIAELRDAALKHSSSPEELINKFSNVDGLLAGVGNRIDAIRRKVPQPTSAPQDYTGSTYKN